MNWRIPGFEKPTISHVIPFAGWIILMILPGIPQSVRYGMQTVAGIVLLFLFRPWRYYAQPQARNLLISLAVGISIFLVWVAPESHTVTRVFPRLADFYRRFGIGLTEFGGTTAAGSSSGEDPQVVWTISRLLGSAFVIAVIEEFFWRGFLYRWLINPRFTDVPVGTFRIGALLLTAVVFGLEHERWVVGMIAGIAYGCLMIRRADIWSSIIAHATTNLALGFYVIGTGSHQFW